MKIGISTSVIQRGQTGVAQYVFALIRELKQYAQEHQFFLFVLEEDLPLFEFVGDAMQIVKVAEWHRPAVKNILWHQMVLPGLVRKHRIDVLHIPSYRRMLWTQPCPTVATIHDLAPFLVSKKYDWKRMFYGRVVVKQLAKCQREIIAISQNTATDIQRFFKLPSSKITVIHNGLDHSRFFPGPGRAAKQWIADRHQVTDPFFLYVARFEHPGKNHVRLIQSFNKLKQETNSNWNLVLGGADWNGAEAIHHAISASPFKNDIKTIGFVPEEDLTSLYRAADVFVYPSLYEGFGMPPLEAMACACPVISSGRGSLSEIIGDAAKIIDPESINDLKEALKELSVSPSERERFRNLGLERAKRFNWQSTAIQTIRIYERTLRIPKRMSIQQSEKELVAF
jgi:glycosyltransferase involved in cell wall biosynthesis